MIDLDDLRMFALLARCNTLAAAARELNVTPPALSSRLKRLEARLGTSLVVRTTRALRFTDEGERLCGHAVAVLAQFDAIAEDVGSAGRALSGDLRVVAPFGFGRRYVGKIVDRFTAKYPQIVVSLQLAETPLAHEPAADVIIHIGAIDDSSWVAYPLASNARWLCASPRYLATNGAPKTPDDLAKHAAITLKENREDTSMWRFRRGAETFAIRITPVLSTNDGEVLCDWAINHRGLMVRSEWDAAPHVRAGRLARVMPGYQIEGADVVALTSTRRGASRRVRTFIDFLRAAFKPRPPWRIA